MSYLLKVNSNTSELTAYTSCYSVKTYSVLPTRGVKSEFEAYPKILWASIWKFKVIWLFIIITILNIEAANITVSQSLKLFIFVLPPPPSRLCVTLPHKNVYIGSAGDLLRLKNKIIFFKQDLFKTGFKTAVKDCSIQQKSSNLSKRLLLFPIIY